MIMGTTASQSKLDGLLRMLQNDPRNAALRSSCVNLAISLADFGRAQQLLDAGLSEEPRDPSVMFDSATLAIARKDYASAIAHLNELRALELQSPAVLVNLGLCHYCLQQWEAAREPLELLYRSGERSAGVLRLYASTLHHLGQLDEAVAIAEANPEPAKTDAGLSGVYALIFVDADKVAAASRWARTTLQLNPDSVDGLVVEGGIRITQMRLSEGREHLQRALQIAPETGRAWLGLGALALLDRDIVQAKQYIERAMGQLSAHVGSWHMLAWTNLLAQDLASAEQAFQRALEMDRNFAESHGGLAAIAALRGDRAAAERGIEVAQRLDPECLSSQFALAVLASGSGDPERARKIIAEAAAGLSKIDASALGSLLRSGPKR
jgi:tetratricopeptide (TPR) repeat protein